MFIPPELICKIFKYFQYDYKTLYSCILLNKQCLNINIPILWKDPFYSIKSTKILIDCMLVEDKDFLVEENIKLKFELLKKPPLYNYAAFITKLDFFDCAKRLKELTGDDDKSELVARRLLFFILNHSSIEELSGVNREDGNWIIKHHRFNACFQNLYRFDFDHTVGYEFSDKLAGICKNIQIFTIDYNDIYSEAEEIELNLAKLIKAQNQIKNIHLYSTNKYNEVYISDEVKEAILTHSNSIIDFAVFGVDSPRSLNTLSLPAAFKNLEILCCNQGILENIKSIFYPKIEDVSFCETRIQDSSDFLKINGSTLKSLKAYVNEVECLGELIDSIGQNCRNLEDLDLFYENEFDQELRKIFNNCTNLKQIKFNCEDKLDGNIIFGLLCQASLKQLKTIVFETPTNISNDSLENLVISWKGPKPFTLKIFNKFHKKNIKHSLDGLVNLLNKYQDLGFLNYELICCKTIFFYDS